MRNVMKIDEIEEQRTRWVDALDAGRDDEICRLASSFRGGDRCTIFQPRKHGAFNVCFFVEFKSPLERWAVRIPNPVTVPKAMLDEKTEIEVATMRYVSAKTTIPIPRIHGYGFSDTGPNGLPFIIMDYVDGKSLKDLGYGKGRTWGPLCLSGLSSPSAATKHVHRQLADVYIQLRQLEFPRIGALGLPSREISALSCNPDDIRVCNRPLSIEMILEELDGLEPSAIFPPKGTCSTAKEYVDGLLGLANNKFEKESDQGLDEAEPASVLYSEHNFKRFVQDDWLNQSANQGPFVLTHGDMEIVNSNLLFDNDHNLVAIIDWEWSRVVPAQLMVPPIWLSAANIDFVLLTQKTFNKQVGQLRAAVQEREKALGLPPVLSTEWAPLETWCHSAIVIGLNCPEHVRLVFWDLIFLQVVPRRRGATVEERMERYKKEIVPRCRAFIEESEERRELMERKIRQQKEFFVAEMKHYGFEVPRGVKRACI